MQRAVAAVYDRKGAWAGCGTKPWKPARTLYIPSGRRIRSHSPPSETQPNEVKPGYARPFLPYFVIWPTDFSHFQSAILRAAVLTASLFALHLHDPSITNFEDGDWLNHFTTTAQFLANVPKAELIMAGRPAATADR